MKKIIWLSILLALFLQGCGGGGGGSTAAVTPSSTTFTAAAAVGELVSYTMNTTSLTYSYTIVESQYGNTGATGSGTLTANADGSYSLSGIPHSAAMVLQNGLLIAAVQENINGTVQTIPILGLSNPLTSMASAVGTYNFVSYQCATTACTATTPFATYGTFHVNADGSWVNCIQADYDTNPAGCTSTNTGTTSNLGSGQFGLINSAGTTVGKIVANTAPNGQNVMLIDLHDAATVGYGMVIGATVAPITSAEANGIWDEGMIGRYNGTPFYATATNTVTGGNTGNLTNFQVDGSAQTNPAASTFTINSPWNGFATNNTSGTVTLLAGLGMIVSFDSTTLNGVPFDALQLGIKMN